MHPENVSNLVREYRADIGLALDGDADRLVVIDENGDIVDGKFTLLLEDDENIFAYSRKNEEKTMIVVCNFFDKEIPMPLAKECEGMEVLISNYKDTSDMSVLRPYEARMYIR
jgi:hypothetical protein